MYDVITFGSATVDIFLRIKKEDFNFEKISVCFRSGSKIPLEKVTIATGGGGTNVACGLANFGLKVAYFGKIGDDWGGKLILEDLKKFKVSPRFLKKDKHHNTNFSFIISSTGIDRIIFFQKGASHYLTKKDLNFKNLKTKWFYIAPLHSQNKGIFKPLINFALSKKIKIAANLSKEQIKNLKTPSNKKLIHKIDILFLNEEEISELANTSFSLKRYFLKKIATLAKGMVVITRGEKGCIVLKDPWVFKARTSFVAPREKTGAGDAFSAGFLSGLLIKNDIEYAIKVGLFNGRSCLKKIGAKEGLLTKEEIKSFPKIQIQRLRLN